MVNTTLGYAGASVAVFFFGTCYVPAKKYPTYDGIIFQWFMCSGILMVGLVWGIFSNEWSRYAEAGLYTFPQGILGGSLFAIANLLIPTVVNSLGLGIGFMLWNGTNITMGYLISRFGLFGVHPTIPSSPLLSELGILLMIGSIAVYGMVKPKLHAPPSKRHRRHCHSHHHQQRPGSYSPAVAIKIINPDDDPEPAGPAKKTSTKTHGTPKRSHALSSSSYSSDDETPRTERSSEHTPLLDGVIKRRKQLVARRSLSETILRPELPNFGPYMIAAEVCDYVALVDESDERARQGFGIVVALIVGAVLGCCLVPYVRWQQACEPTQSVVVSTCNPLNFIFSQCLGIYITSTIAFLAYSLFHRFIKRSMPRSVMRPAYMCGVLWALGLGGQLLSAGNIGFDQAYPLTSIGPAMVSMLWSALYFKEIEGRRNVVILCIATCMVLCGTALRTIAS